MSGGTTEPFLVATECDRARRTARELAGGAASVLQTAEDTDTHELCAVAADMLERALEALRQAGDVRGADAA